MLSTVSIWRSTYFPSPWTWNSYMLHSQCIRISNHLRAISWWGERCHFSKNMNYPISTCYVIMCSERKKYSWHAVRVLEHLLSSGAWNNGSFAMNVECMWLHLSGIGDLILCWRSVCNKRMRERRCICAALFARSFAMLVRVWCVCMWREIQRLLRVLSQMSGVSPLFTLAAPLLHSQVCPLFACSDRCSLPPLSHTHTHTHTLSLSHRLVFPHSLSTSLTAQKALHSFARCSSAPPSLLHCSTPLDPNASSPPPHPHTHTHTPPLLSHPGCHSSRLLFQGWPSHICAATLLSGASHGYQIFY